MAREWRTHTLFGIVLATDFSFASHLGPVTGSPDLTFTCSPDPPLAVRWERLSPIYESPYRISETESLAYLYRLDGCEVLRYSQVADFYLWPERIVCHLLDPAHGYLVELRLLGPVFSYWLERQGIPALHASAVAVGEKAAVFLSNKSGGKTSLAAALMGAGYPLLTDDLLAVEERNGTFLGRPGYPQVRMWPNEACHFLGHYENFDIVHPAYSKRRIPVAAGLLGRFCDSSHPLVRLYLLDRRRPTETGRIEMVQISPRNATVELIRLSFSPHLIEAAGPQAQRLELLSRLALRVPLRRLVYPGGLDRLPLVVEAILEDLEDLPPARRQARR